MIPLKKARKNRRLSEEALCHQAGISRMTLRAIERFDPRVTLKTLLSSARVLERRVVIVAMDDEFRSDFSTVAVSYKVMRDGFESWKIHFMELVDEFRRTLDTGLLVLPPSQVLDPRLSALLASIVLQLCFESHIQAPHWATIRRFLSKPWFVSGSESLKASALMESPLFFRQNNIFVLENFLERA